MKNVEILAATTALPTIEVAQLDSNLDAIQELGEKYLQGYVSSRKKLHGAMAAGLCLFFQAELIPGYLDQKYKEAGIEYHKPKDGRINPTPFLKLTLGLDSKTHASMLSDHSKAFVGLYNTFADHPKKLEADFHETVYNAIRDKKGLRFYSETLKSEADLDKEELAYAQGKDADKATSKGAVGSVDLAQSARDAFLKSQLATALGISAQGTVPAFSSGHANDNGLVVMLGRQKPGSADIDIVATSASDDVVDDVLINAVEPDLSQVPGVLRLIADGLRTHVVPRKLARHRATYFDKSKNVMRRDKEGNWKSISITTWLAIDPERQEITVSKTPAAPCGITQVKPKEWLPYEGEAVALMGADLRFVETSLLVHGELPIWTTEQGNDLVENTNDGQRSQFCIPLATLDGERERTLHFNTLSSVPEETNNGRRIPDVTPDVQWTVRASAQDFAGFSARTADKWSAGVGAHLNKAPNRSMGFTIVPGGIGVHWWFDGDRQEYMDSYDVPFDRNSPFELDGIPDMLELAPKDAMPMFAGIADMQLATNEVLMQGTKDGLYLSFETELAHFRCFLPAIWQYRDWEKDERRNDKRRSREKNAGTS